MSRERAEAEFAVECLGLRGFGAGANLHGVLIKD